MGRFVNPFTDVGFKILFGQEVSKPTLLILLNTLLEGERKITNVTFLDKEQPAEYKDDRSLIYDVLCETETGERIIVEMQNKGQPFFADRCLYYYSQAVVRQGEKGDKWNYKINAVYLIAFLNFRMGELGDNIRTDVRLINSQTGEQFSDKERFIFLQLPCFDKEAKDCETMFDRLMYVFKNMAVLERMPWEAKDQVFRRLAKIAEVRNLTKEERLRYDQSLKHYRDSINVMQGVLEEGHAKGFAEGRAEGFDEGEKRGEKRGEKKGEKRGDRNASVRIARQFKAMGIPIPGIAKGTGLSVEEVTNL